jgi:hypothetical protein
MAEANGALNANFLANGQKFKISSLPAKVPPIPPNIPSTTFHPQSTVSLNMERELCLGCHRWFSRMEQHLPGNHHKFPLLLLLLLMDSCPLL